MASIFTRIINGEIPSYKVAEDENFLAFLNTPFHSPFIFIFAYLYP